MVFCLVDRLDLCQDNFSREVIKNQTDFIISSLVGKRYNVYQGLNENQLLRTAAEDNYEFAVVFSTGTEFINGSLFFNKMKELVQQDFFLCGHVLDRDDAYYELHHQCYIINLKIFKKLGAPIVGDQDLGSKHIQISPSRSQENIHDHYTPIWVSTGTISKNYKHKCHGWNILKTAFEQEQKVLVFDQEFRQGKRHHYPENRQDFLKNLSWIYYRDLECSSNFVHTANTECLRHVKSKFEQVIIPASGTLYLDYINSGSVVMYDYNEKSLQYWQKHLPRKEGISYSFVKVDLLGDNNLLDYVDKNKTVLINLSNVFAYEGTSALRPLYYRLHKENKIIEDLQKKNSGITIAFSVRAATGFLALPMVGTSSIIKPTDLKCLKKTTWHNNRDWEQS